MRKFTFLLILLIGVASVSAQPVTILREAEHTALTGQAMIQGGTGASGSAVTVGNSAATWDVVCPGGEYRLFAHVRAGWSGEHNSGVKEKTLYRAQVGGRELAFSLMPNTLTYYGDESNWAWVVASVGPLKQGWHQIEFKSDWYWGKWDTFVMSSDPTYVPAANPPFGKETPVELTLLTDTADRRKYFAFTVWPAEPAANCAPDSRPQEGAETNGASCLACINEFEPVCFNVTNWTEERLLLRCSPVTSDATTSKKTWLPLNKLRILTPVPLRCWTGTELADPVPELPGSGLLEIPSNETRQLWLEISTHGVAAGDYEAMVDLEPIRCPARAEKARLHITVKVARIRLPEKHPLVIYTNEYDTTQPGRYADMTSHYVNAYQICVIPHPALANPDYAAMDDWIRLERKQGMARILCFEHWHFRTDPGWRKPENRAAWVRGIRKWATHLRKDLGLKYEDYVLHSYDEQAGPAVEEYLEARKIIREADPNIRELVTIGSVTTLDEVKRMNEPKVIWAPYMGFLREKDRSVLDYVKTTGHPVWPYECGEDKRGWDPQARYRVWPWVLYRERVKGLFLWMYLVGNAWDGRAWDGGVVYPGIDCVVTSRRWEMLRQGLEDYLLLQIADHAGKHDLVQSALDSLLQDGGNTALLRKHRENLIHALSQ